MEPNALERALTPFYGRDDSTPSDVQAALVACYQAATGEVVHDPPTPSERRGLRDWFVVETMNGGASLHHKPRILAHLPAFIDFADKVSMFGPARLSLVPSAGRRSRTLLLSD